MEAIERLMPKSEVLNLLGGVSETHALAHVQGQAISGPYQNLNRDARAGQKVR